MGIEVTIEEVWRKDRHGQEVRLYKTSQPIWDAIDDEGMREIRVNQYGDEAAMQFEYICIAHQIEDAYKFGAGNMPATLALTCNDLGNTINYAPLPGSVMGCWVEIEQVLRDLNWFLNG